MEAIISNDEYKFAFAISEKSKLNLHRFREEEVFRLDHSAAIGVDSDLSKKHFPRKIKLRVRQVFEILELYRFDPKYWYFSDQISPEIWKITNPYLARDFYVVFEKNKKNIISFAYKKHGSLFPTGNLITAIKQNEV